MTSHTPGAPSGKLEPDAEPAVYGRQSDERGDEHEHNEQAGNGHVLCHARERPTPVRLRETQPRRDNRHGRERGDDEGKRSDEVTPVRAVLVAEAFRHADDEPDDAQEEQERKHRDPAPEPVPQVLETAEHVPRDVLMRRQRAGREFVFAVMHGRLPASGTSRWGWCRELPARGMHAHLPTSARRGSPGC